MKKYVITACACLLVAHIAMGETTVTLESAINVGSWTTIQNVTEGDNIDAPIATYTKGGIRFWTIPNVVFQSNPWDYVVWYSTTIGSLNSPLGIAFLAYSQAQYNFMYSSTTATTGTGGRKWICNTYQDATGVLGFVHVEYALNNTPQTLPTPGHTRIGIAWLWDDDIGGQPDWKYCGHAIAPYSDPAPFNIHGVAYIIKNVSGTDYFYVYFHEYSTLNGGWGNIGVARSPVANVMHNARLGKVTNWYKYDDGTWTLTGQASPIGLWPIVAHGDAAYSTHTGKYYFAGWIPSPWKSMQGVNQSEIRIFESSDGLDWEHISTIGAISADDRQYQYLTIIDDDGSDNGIIDDKFYLYAVWRNISNSQYLLNRFTLSLSEN